MTTSSGGEFGNLRRPRPQASVSDLYQQPSAARRRHSPDRGSIDFLSLLGIILPGVALIATSFIPWISIRLPGLEHKYLTLNELSGGRFLVGLVAVLMLVGLPLSLVRFRVGSVFLALAAGLFGWFAGLAVVTIGLIRILIPDVALAGIDVAGGLIGQGPGVVLALGAAIVLSAELARSFVGADRNQRQSGVYGLLALVLIVALAAANHSHWVVVDSDALNSQIAISGDSLFGSVIVSVLMWGAGAFAAGHLAGIAAAKSRILAVLLILLAALKALQLIVVWAGTSFLDWILPSGVGGVANLDLRMGFFFSGALSAAALALSVIGLASPALVDRPVSLNPLSLAPAAALAVATVSMTFFYNPGTPGDVAAEVSNNSSTSVLEAVTTTSTSEPLAESSGSDTDVTLSTAFVVIADDEDYICAFGSGAFVGDGSYVVTNEHVVSSEGLDAGCDWLGVAFGEDPSAEPDTWYAAEVLWSDGEDDLAIVQLVDLRAGETRPLQIRYDRLKLGDEVSVFGFPGIGGDTLTLTKGIISGFDSDYGFYKVSAAINKGNSGGPVLDAQGRLIGIATAVFRSEIDCGESQICYSDGTNLGLVRPIDAAKSAIGEYVK
jgi:S1-C subfamily serine protease